MRLDACGLLPDSKSSRDETKLWFLRTCGTDGPAFGVDEVSGLFTTVDFVSVSGGEDRATIAGPLVPLSYGALPLAGRTRTSVRRRATGARFSPPDSRLPHVWGRNKASRGNQRNRLAPKCGSVVETK